ncbi:peptidoglycan DD-metalloendopeptidase family protein [Haliea sp. E17]|uniref:peptidoglycan DD-metalloendopeptidase family protein n=1 Tax=Haliea sp. E17 TaxID=3401576 RepID=UPI003AB0473B
MGAALLAGLVAVVNLQNTNTAEPINPADIEALLNPYSQANTAPRVPLMANIPLEAAAPKAEVARENHWDEETVRSGDNLSLIFKRAGYNMQDVYNVTSSPDGNELTRIYPGQTIAFQGSDDGQLLAVRYEKNPLETIQYTWKEEGFVREVTTREPEIRRVSAAGEIRSSLYTAGIDAGLSVNTIMDMANIFGGVIDFVGDPRKGDTVEVVLEQAWLDGEKYSDGAILAASYTNQGKTYTAYRYTDSAGDTGYYNEDGMSMRRAFLLAPVDFTRISSNFNPKRLHPVLGTVRPHRGTDYAAPTGTPVYAAGDGKVIKAGYSSANGNYVFIKHGDQFETKYLHLNKRKASVGQKVSQGDVIGTVGSTGLASGPHLHYEFLMNGVHRNPRTIHKYLPKTKTLPAAELAAFHAAIAETSSMLAAARGEENTRLAMHEKPENRG